ncbi:MAG TPA: ATP-binding cassette domain-containing protein [Sporichthyaceae bacterium]|jgi:ABC-type branched-subunit amino acid transport system ATPase component
MKLMPDLTITELSVRFGGLNAVQGLSLHAAAGTITALIGPNGAGKTTTFNACTGVVRHTAGQVYLGQRHLDRLSTAARAAAGLGRTFQRMELFDSMSVQQNVAMGPEGVFSARRPWGQFWAPSAERSEIGARAAQALRRCGLDGIADRRVRDLSTGQRRLVELARAMASPFRFLLLDEPSSGLDVHETEEFGAVLSQHVADTGIGVLLVEHDMALVARVCTQVYVLDFGRLIWSGPTAEALAAEAVRAAYLGGDVEDCATDPTQERVNA